MRKVCGIFASVFSVVFLSSCVADTKYKPKMSSNASVLQWEEMNGGAALPLAAAIKFCGKEATDESAKIAAVLSVDKTYTTVSPSQVLGTESLDKVKASEMSKCMAGLGYGKK